MTYNVVYEIIPQANGYGGHRVIRPYTDKVDFEKNPFPAETHQVIAEGISDFEANRLICEAPAVCFVIAPLNVLFDNKGSLIQGNPEGHISTSGQIRKAAMALIALEDIRGRLHHWDSLPLPEALSKMVEDFSGTGTEQHQIYSMLVNLYVDDLLEPNIVYSRLLEELNKFPSSPKS